MSVPISTSSTSSTSYTQARNTTASDNINYVAKDSLNTGGQFNNRKVGYVCEVCYEKFTYKSNYTRHIQTHTGEKPFKCTKCDTAFLRKEHLKRHARSAHEVAEMLKINSSNCNNTRDEMINSYYKEMQDICNSRKIKFYPTSMIQMLIALKENTEILQKPEKLDLFCHKTILF